MAVSQSFTFFAHETWDFWYIVTDGTNPIDLTGAEVKWVLRKTATSPIDLLTKTSTNGGIRIDADQVNNKGSLYFEITPEENKARNIKGSLYFELQVTNADDEVKKVAYGTININPTAIRE